MNSQKALRYMNKTDPGFELPSLSLNSVTAVDFFMLAVVARVLAVVIFAVASEVCPEQTSLLCFKKTGLSRIGTAGFTRDRAFRTQNNFNALYIFPTSFPKN